MPKVSLVISYYFVDLACKPYLKAVKMKLAQPRTGRLSIQNTNYRTRQSTVTQGSYILEGCVTESGHRPRVITVFLLVIYRKIYLRTCLVRL